MADDGANLVALWARLYKSRADHCAALEADLRRAEARSRRQHLQFCLVLSAAAVVLPSASRATLSQVIAAFLIAIATLIDPLCEYARSSVRRDCQVDSE